jgi:hypothetical protein
LKYLFIIEKSEYQKFYQYPELKNRDKTKAWLLLLSRYFQRKGKIY